MNDSKSVLANLPWASLLAIALALAGNLWNPASLDSQRPKAAPLQGKFAGPLSQDGFGAVAMQMTEDPFAVYDGPKPTTAQREREPDLLRTLLEKLGSAASDQKGTTPLVQDWFRSRVETSESFVALMVLVPGGIDVVSREERIRTRYAVEAALKRADYEVRTADRMVYVDVVIHPDLGEAEMKAKGARLQDPRAATIRVPLKLYDAPDASPKQDCDAAPKRKQVLVCWIDSDRLGRRRLAALDEVAEELFGQGYAAACDSIDELQICVLGPWSSDDLRSMQSEVLAWDGNGSGVARTRTFRTTKNVHIVSPRATLDSFSVDSARISSILTRKVGPHATFERTIGTDDLLVKALRHELELRDKWPTKTEGFVVLVHEHDTAYGRGIAKSFKDSFEGEVSCTAKNESSLPRIISRTYLRGIDGRAARADAEKENDKENKGTSTGTGSGSAPSREDPSHGTTQYDYLRRLEQEIYEESERRRIRDQGELLAVGVVGTDVYDKLLVLRALRRRFPRVIFFTTDLDAELMQESERRWTRNLIVASHFGLSLRDELQGSIPPFRESYQTSMFLGCLIGLQRCGAAEIRCPFNGQQWLLPSVQDIAGSDHAALERAWTNTNYLHPSIWCPEHRLTPLVFEMGRTRPYPLTQTGRPVGDPSCDPAWTSAWIHPPSPRQHRYPPLWWRAIVAIPLCGMAIAFIVGERRVRATVKAATCWDIIAPFLVCVFGRLCDSARRLFNRGSASTRSPARCGCWTNAIRSAAPHWRRSSALWFAIWSGIGGVGWLVSCVYCDHFAPGGEPFALFEGISMWPVNFVRLTAGITAVVSVVLTWASLKKNSTDVTKNFDLKRDGAIDRLVSSEFLGVGVWPQWLTTCLRFVLTFSLMAVVFIFGIGVPGFMVFGRPSNPARGEFCQGVTDYVLILSVVATVVLTFVVVQVVVRVRDALRACGGEAGETHLSIVGGGWCWRWSPQRADNEVGLAVADGRNSRQTIRLVANRTDVVSRIATYPGIAVLLLLLARNPMFDNLDFPLFLLLLVAVQIILPLLTYVQLKTSAGKFRERHLQKLRDAEMAFVAAGKEDDAKRIKVFSDEIKAEREGAFADWLHDKAFSIFLIPLGGTGAVLVIEKLIALYPGY